MKGDGSYVQKGMLEAKEKCCSLKKQIIYLEVVMRTKIFIIFYLVTVYFVFALLGSSIDSAWGAEERYPSRPIELFCGYAPGGLGDLTNRFLATGLEKYLNVSVIPGNRPGGGESVNATYISNSSPDGYTLGTMADGALTYPPLLGRPYDYFPGLRIIGQATCTSLVMAVSTESPWKTLQEFIDYAHKNPGLNYAHSGIGTLTQVYMELVNKAANLNMRGVPFRGDAEVAQAVLGKHVSAGLFSYQAARYQADAGKMRILICFTPSELSPEPTLPSSTSILGREMYGILYGGICLAAPRKIPENIFEILVSTLEKVTKDQEFIDRLKTLYAHPCFIDGTTIQQRIPIRQQQIKPILQSIGVIK